MFANLTQERIHVVLDLLIELETYSKSNLIGADSIQIFKRCLISFLTLNCVLWYYYANNTFDCLNVKAGLDGARVVLNANVLNEVKSKAGYQRVLFPC